MNPLTLEWIKKAEADLISAQRENRARNQPNYDSAWFHAQQCVEKYLKGWLHDSGKTIPHIHNLAELVSLCAETDNTFAYLEPELKELNIYAVRTRYPGENATKEDAREAIRISNNARNFIRTKFGIL